MIIIGLIPLALIILIVSSGYRRRERLIKAQHAQRMAIARGEEPPRFVGLTDPMSLKETGNRVAIVVGAFALFVLLIILAGH